MSDGGVRRWDELPLERVTEMVSRKVIADGDQAIAQVYLRRGAHVPLYRPISGRMLYVLQGELACAVTGRELRVKEGEVLHIPSGARHQAVALDDTFVLVVRGGVSRDHAP